MEWQSVLFLVLVVAGIGHDDRLLWFFLWPRCFLCVFCICRILPDFVEDTRSASAYIQPDVLTPANLPYTTWKYDSDYPRQPGLLKPGEGSNLEIVGGQRLTQHQPVAVFGKRLRLQVQTGGSATFVPDRGTGGVAVSDGQIFFRTAKFLYCIGKRTEGIGPG